MPLKVRTDTADLIYPLAVRLGEAEPVSSFRVLSAVRLHAGVPRWFDRITKNANHPVLELRGYHRRFTSAPIYPWTCFAIGAAQVQDEVRDHQIGDAVMQRVEVEMSRWKDMTRPITYSTLKEALTAFRSG